VDGPLFVRCRAKAKADKMMRSIPLLAGAEEKAAR
jgi:hypothetical protein